MKLTRVTITGADDAVPHQALYDLSAEFPFVEWGVLYSNTRKGTPRYPSSDWLQQLELRRHQFSVHLCGQAAREVMGGADLVITHHGKIRIQLNGFSAYVLPELLVARQYHETEFILQCSSLDAFDMAHQWRSKYPNVSALWDCSGGKGEPMAPGPLPDGVLPLGLAGGLNEHNIVSSIARLTGVAYPHEFWVDLETGARTDDKFDLAKVRRILELAKPFVGAHVGGR